MKRFQTTLILFFILISFNACESAFSTLVDIEIENDGSQITVNCIYGTDWQGFNIQLSRSKGILEPNDTTTLLPDALVELYANEVLIETQSVDNFEKQSTTIHLTTIPQPNTRYRLKVHSTSYPTAEATNLIPSSVPIKQAYIIDTSLCTSSNNSFNSEGINITLAIDFEDPSTIENYYYLFIHLLEKADPNRFDSLDSPIINEIGDTINIPDVFSKSVAFRTQDASFDTNGNVIDELNPEFAGTAYFERGFALFSDELFEGTAKTIQVQVCTSDTYFHNIDPTQIVGFRIELGSVSKDYYLYQKSLSLQAAIIDDPSAEPVRVFSNIENGTGIFAGYSSHHIELKNE